MKLLTITLINGKVFKLPTSKVHKGDNVTRLDLETGSKRFANWYITSIK